MHSSPSPLLLGLFAALFSAAALASSTFILRDQTYTGPDLVLGPGLSRIVIQNVNFPTSVSIRIDTYLMNPESWSLSFGDLLLSHSSLLHIQASGTSLASQAHSVLTMNNVTTEQSTVAFSGHFPPQCSIAITSSTFDAAPITIGGTLPIDVEHFGLSFFDIFYVGNTNVLVEGCTFTATAPGSDLRHYLFMIGGMANGSRFLVQDCGFHCSSLSSSSAVHFDFAYEHSSTLALYRNTFETCDSDIDLRRIDVQHSSALAIMENMHSTNAMSFTDFVVHDHSFVFVTAEHSPGMLFVQDDITQGLFSDNSVISVSDSSTDGPSLSSSSPFVFDGSSQLFVRCNSINGNVELIAIPDYDNAGLNGVSQVFPCNNCEPVIDCFSGLSSGVHGTVPDCTCNCTTADATTYGLDACLPGSLASRPPPASDFEQHCPRHVRAPMSSSGP